MRYRIVLPREQMTIKRLSTIPRLPRISSWHDAGGERHDLSFLGFVHVSEVAGGLKSKQNRSSAEEIKVAASTKGCGHFIGSIFT